MSKVIIAKSQFRGDFEVQDESGKCLGFVWPYADHWVCRVGNNEAQAEYFDTFDEAIERAKEKALQTQAAAK